MDTLRCLALFAILLAASLVRGEEQAPVPTAFAAAPAEGLVATSEENETAYFPVMMTLRVVQFTGAEAEFKFEGKKALDQNGTSLTTVAGDGREIRKAVDKFVTQDFVTNDTTAVYSVKLSGASPWSSRDVRRVPTGRQQMDIATNNHAYLSPNGKLQVGIELIARNTLHEGTDPPKSRSMSTGLFMDLGQTLVYESAPFKVQAKDGAVTSYRWLVVAVAKLAER